jgi:hypothetical protein
MAQRWLLPSILTMLCNNCSMTSPRTPSCRVVYVCLHVCVYVCLSVYQYAFVHAKKFPSVFSCSCSCPCSCWPRRCVAVLCCRLSPIQKALVVKLIKYGPEPKPPKAHVMRNCPRSSHFSPSIILRLINLSFHLSFYPFSQSYFFSPTLTARSSMHQ